MTSEICYIIGAGDFYGPQIQAAEGDYVIGVDGGYRYTSERGIPCDVVLGDFDSLGEVPEHPHLVQLDVIKDDTDMLAALKIGLDAGYHLFYIYGGTGGKRISHTLANFQCLVYLAQHGARGYLFDQDSVVTAITNQTVTFPGTYSGYLSVFSHSDSSHGVCERGLKYELDHVTLTSAFPIGVSNEFIGLESVVSVEEGTLMLVYEAKNLSL